MTTNIDTLNDLDPLNMSLEDIDALIRAHRQRREAGASRPKKEAGPKQSLDLADLGLVKPQAPVKVVRRI